MWAAASARGRVQDPALTAGPPDKRAMAPQALWERPDLDLSQVRRACHRTGRKLLVLFVFWPDQRSFLHLTLRSSAYLRKCSVLQPSQPCDLTATWHDTIGGERTENFEWRGIGEE